MIFRIDFMSQISVEVKADDDDTAVEIARKELNSYMTRMEFISNADVTNIDIVPDK